MGIGYQWGDDPGWVNDEGVKYGNFWDALTGNNGDDPNKPKKPQIKWKAGQYKTKGNSYGYTKWEYKNGKKTGNKKWVEVKDLTNINRLMGLAQNTQYPDYQSWLDSQGYNQNDIQTSTPWAGLQGLQDQIATGINPEEQTAYASSVASGLTGLENVPETLAGLYQDITTGRGMTDEQRANRERYYATEIQQIERKATEDIQRMAAGSQSTYSMLSKAEESRREIRDARIAANVAIDDEEWRRVEAKSQMYGQLLQTQQIGSEQYLQMKYQSWSQLANNYAMQISTLLQENSQYLQQYGQEMERIDRTVQNYYNAINAELGVDMAMVDLYESSVESLYAKYAMEMEQYGIDMQDYYLQQQDQQQQAANALDFFTTALQIIGTLALI